MVICLHKMVILIWNMMILFMDDSHIFVDQSGLRGSNEWDPWSNGGSVLESPKEKLLSRYNPRI